MCNVMRSSSVMHSHPSATQPFLTAGNWASLEAIAERDIAFAFLSSRSWITPSSLLLPCLQLRHNLPSAGTLGGSPILGLILPSVRCVKRNCSCVHFRSDTFLKWLSTCTEHETS